jgi:hypothetical protein
MRDGVIRMDERGASEKILDHPRRPGYRLKFILTVGIAGSGGIRFEAASHPSGRSVGTE